MAQRISDILRIGIIRLCDVAPYLMAAELDLYRQAGLRVELAFELGWASIKHKIAYGELDAAQALAPLPLSIAAGFGVAPTPCRALTVTSRLGNALTLSRGIQERGVRTAEDFRRDARSPTRTRHYTLGIVSLDSSHHFLLRQWLRQTGLDPDHDVKIVVVPPGQALRNLRAQTLDGYCVGEPWNSLAVREGLGWCPALSHDLVPGHPEKVLLACESQLAARPEQFAALTQVLTQACMFCANPENIPQIARTLRRKSILGPAATGVEKTLRGEFDRGNGQGLQMEPVIDFGCEGRFTPDASDLDWIQRGATDAGWLALGEHELKSLAERVYAPLG
ncbi:ABC transporter substrate-binding protein [Ruficoccus amylovorans]|uniref:ABC transporter substrate-binding protein n=1 Tax=Ruficoccus amylovorans TaxID=1804625 RepID=A0A842HIY1_9BACT|nr:ABC transporter substrate-binding protein [Ruficoccus amylovorans]